MVLRRKLKIKLFLGEITANSHTVYFKINFVSFEHTKIFEFLVMSHWRRQPKRSNRRLLFGISRRPEEHTVSSI